MSSLVSASQEVRQAPSSKPADPEDTVEIELSTRRELRVVLPTEVHRKLRSLKILRGVNIGECVTHALEQYFEERPDLARLVAGSGMPPTHQVDESDE